MFCFVRNSLITKMASSAVLLCALLALTVQGKPSGGIKAGVCGYEACPSYDPDALNVHVVPHSHDDVGWLKTVDQYYFQDVEYILSSVVDALKQNPARRFVQVETAFFKKWWEEQDEEKKQDTIDLINNGQLEMINGGWSMNDEGAVHYQSTIDQYTLGLRYLEDKLGKCARPRVGWQIDPFGHSREQASISAQLGFDSMFFARLDYRDKAARRARKATDLLWRGSSNLGNTSDLFTSMIHNHYSAPGGFCFDIVCDDEPIIDDEESPDYNYERKVADFGGYARSQSEAYPTNNVLVTMGDDFRYEAAQNDYINMDRLIKGFELFPQFAQDKPIRVFYSTPSCYTKHVNEYVKANDLELELKTDDFMPLCDDPNSYVVGYFTSRPTSKRFERQSNNFLQVAKQLSAIAHQPYGDEDLNSLREILGVMQHHDAITGTEMQHVTDNYHVMMAQGVARTNLVTDGILTTLLSGQDESLGFNSCLLSNISYCPQTKSDKFTVAVYNPLSRVVSTPITLPVDSTSWRVLDPDDNEVSYQIVPSIRDFSYVTDAEPSDNDMVFTAADIPALGLKVFRVEKSDAEKEEEEEIKQEKDLKANQVIGWEDTNVAIDGATGLVSAVTMNGLTMAVKQELLYYTSRAGSGAYQFHPDVEKPYKIATDGVKTTLISGDIYRGVLQEFSSWAKQIIKVYNDDRGYIEFDWVVGPLDLSDDSSKEVVSQFTSSLATDDIFYTDSNGREMLQRKRYFRPTFEYTNEQPVAGNYWPVNTRIVLRDERQGMELAVITDRSEGGSSLMDGQLELMIHRACIQADFGFENLHEEQYGQNLVVRGQHYLVLGLVSGRGGKSLAAIERELALRKQLAPWTFVTDKDLGSNLKNLQLSFLKAPLPDNVHLLTLEPWGEDALLIRLEHILEKGEDSKLSQEVTVDLADAFTAFTIVELREMALGANMLLEEVNRLEWPGSSEGADNSGSLDINDRLKRDPTDLKIALAPMQIRTFVATVTFN